MADVFISYRNTPERRALVERLAFILHAYRIDVWWDYDLAVGKSFQDEIARELSAALIVAPMWCSESIRSEWVLSEARLGGSKLMPARFQKVVPPDDFKNTHAADLVGWDGSASDLRLHDFARRICERLGRPVQIPLHTQRQLALLPPVAPLPEVAPVVAAPSTNAAGPAHDYAFWERQWDRYGTSDNLIALQDIADEAPRLFANQAKARITEIEAEQERLARERAAAEARQRAEQERIAKEKAAAEEAAREREAARARVEAEDRERLVLERAAAEARQRAEQQAARYEADGRIKVDAASFFFRSPYSGAGAVKAGWLKPGAGEVEWFKDLDIGPEMVVVPGNPAFAIGRFTVTFAEWDAAQAHPAWQKYGKIEPRNGNDRGWGRGKQPVIDVSWYDAEAYCNWLSVMTGMLYALPSRAQWEQACRAGTKTEFWWGNEISTDHANYDGNHIFRNGKKGEYRKRTVAVDSFKANHWGLYQVHGNVWEWCDDAFYPSARVVRGGSWGSFPDCLRASFTDWAEPGIRNDNLSFRVVRLLAPARTL